MDAEELIEHVARRGRRYLCRVAYNRLLGADEADDVVQESLLIAWASRDQLRDPDQALGWVAGIVANRCYKARRAAYRYRRRQMIAASLAPSHSAPDAAAADAVRSVDLALEQLPPAFSEIARLHFLEDRSAREICEILGLGRGAVEYRIGVARARLRELLAGEV